jgi:hypothetical protein
MPEHGRARDLEGYRTDKSEGRDGFGIPSSVAAF